MTREDLYPNLGEVSAAESCVLALSAWYNASDIRALVRVRLGSTRSNTVAVCEPYPFHHCNTPHRRGHGRCRSRRVGGREVRCGQGM